MKALLVSVTAGYGHHSAANALVAALEKKGVEVRFADLFKYINKFLYGTVDKGYLYSTKFIPRQFGNMYRLAEKHDDMNKNHIAALATSLMAGRFKKFFTEFEPDVIICTHCFAAQVMDYLKRTGKINCMLTGVVTDFTIHPFWRDLSRTEYILTASELLSYKAIKKDIDPSILLPFGIPINEKFSRCVDRYDARRELGLDPAKQTVLVASGSMGHNLVNIINELDNSETNFQIICVCGNNKAAYEKLSAYTARKPLKVFGFVNNIDLMMDASDCIITKPGGLSTSEALAKKLPMILVNPIPGQEEYNRDFLVNTGVALAVNKHFTVGEAAHILFNMPGRIEQIKRSMQTLSHPDAAERFANCIIDACVKRRV